MHEAECTPPYADGARSCVRSRVRQERRAVAKYSVGLLEEELKNKVAAVYYAIRKCLDATRLNDRDQLDTSRQFWGGAEIPNRE